MGYSAMTDEADDVRVDECFYTSQGADGKWRLFDVDVESACKDTLAEMRAFVHGLWRGMACTHEVDLTCGVYNSNGVLIDTWVSAEFLAE